MLYAKLFFYHPELLCHSILLGKNYSTPTHSFGRGLVLYLYVHINISFKNLSYHPSLLCQSMPIALSPILIGQIFYPY